MTNESENFIDNDLLLERDARAALLRNKMPTVDTDHAWEQFIAQHGGGSNRQAGSDTEQAVGAAEKKGSRARLISLSAGAGLLVGVAATLLCLFLLRPKPAADSQKPLLVSQYVEQQAGVEMTGMTADTSPNAAETANKQTVTQEIIDVRREQHTAVTSHTVTTPRGTVQKIILADGTTVLLNNESRLRFPSRFTGDKRVVWLEGEAYFTVAKDKQHPFIVKSRNLSTTALGTEFNVSAYAGKDLRVTLVKGSVLVADSVQGKSVILKPGQDVRTVNDNLVIRDTDTRTYTEWNEGFFYYDNVPLVDILVELGRWYNVNIELQDRSLMSYRLHLIADRNGTLDDVVERINQFSYLSAFRKGDNLYIREKKQAE